MFVIKLKILSELNKFLYLLKRLQNCLQHFSEIQRKGKELKRQIESD